MGRAPLGRRPLGARQHRAPCVHRRVVLRFCVQLQAVEQQRHACRICDVVRFEFVKSVNYVIFHISYSVIFIFYYPFLLHSSPVCTFNFMQSASRVPMTLRPGMLSWSCSWAHHTHKSVPHLSGASRPRGSCRSRRTARSGPASRDPPTPSPGGTQSRRRRQCPAGRHAPISALLEHTGFYHVAIQSNCDGACAIGTGIGAGNVRKLSVAQLVTCRYINAVAIRGLCSTRLS